MHKTMSERPGWGVLHQMFSREVQHAIKNGPNQISNFVKMRGQ